MKKELDAMAYFAGIVYQAYADPTPRRETYEEQVGREDAERLAKLRREINDMCGSDPVYHEQGSDRTSQ